MQDDDTTNSHYITYTLLFRNVGDLGSELNVSNLRNDLAYYKSIHNIFVILINLQKIHSTLP